MKLFVLRNESTQETRLETNILDSETSLTTCVFSIRRIAELHFQFYLLFNLAFNLHVCPVSQHPFLGVSLLNYSILYASIPLEVLHAVSVPDRWCSSFTL